MKVAIIIGSTRQGRQSDRLAHWVHLEATKHGDAETVDLRDYPMPFFDEAISPRYNPERSATPEVQKWLDKIAEFDAYVIVTPEYNRAMPAVLKNAFDHLGYEADNKPVALVAHGSSGGAQSAATLRISLPGNGVVTIPQALFFSDHLGESINDAGELDETKKANPYGPQAQLTAQIASLKWYSDALAGARANA